MKDYAQYSDQDLFRAMKRDNFDAFNEIYRRYWKRLYMYACNILEDQGTSEDVIQDVFSYLYWKRKELFVTNLKSYLFQAVKFQVIHHLRKRKLARNYIDRINTIQFVDQTEESVNLKELEASIKNFLLELPERCSEIFYLSRYEHLSHREIAERLDISKQTVKNQITKALNHLRIKLAYLTSLIITIFHFLK